MTNKNPNIKICERCKTNKKYTEFYKLLKATDIYPDGHLNVCRSCLANTFVARDPSTFMNVLYAMDMPWLPSEWQRVFDATYKPSAPNNIAILGKYIAKLKLVQYKDYKFADSDYLQKQVSDEATFDSIDNYDYKIPLVTPIMSTRGVDFIKIPNVVEEGTLNSGVERSFTIVSPLNDGSNEVRPSEPNDRLELTREEMTYLRMKWGVGYSADEAFTLERKYHEMMNSFDIQTSIEEDYIRKICVASMRLDKSLEMNDIDGANTLSAMYDKLTKSAKLQPSQNDKGEGDYMQAVSYLVKLAEQEGPIPRFDFNENPDIVDLTLKDLKLFTKRLVENDESILDRHELAKAALEEQDKILNNQEIAPDSDDDIDITFETDVYDRL